MKLIFGMILCLLCSHMKGMDSNAVDPQAILDKIYSTHQDFRIEKPSIEVSSTNEYVAKYSPGSNVIKVEQRVIDLCKSYTEYGDDALAFIIGHELAHAYQGHLDNNTETSFLAYNKAFSREHKKKHDVTMKEREADIFGSFCAYLAGYDIKKVFPEIINDIYAAYNLTDRILPQYPTKSARNKTATNMMSKLDSLVCLYDAGISLSLAGHYMEASSSFNYISQYYNNNEILNSQGVNYLLEALNLSKLNNEKYYYPIEIDVTSRLHKAQKTASSKDLSPEDRMMFTFLISNSLEKFYESIQRDPTYLTGYINILCAYTIDNRLDQVGIYIQKNNLDELFYKNADADQRAAYEITKAIWQKKSGNIKQGDQSLKAILKSNSENIASLASLNLNTENNEIDEAIRTYSTSPNFNDIIRTKPIRSKPVMLNDKYGISITWWSIKGKRHFYVTGENEIIIKETDPSDNYENCDLKFLNREIEVRTCNTATSINIKGKKPIVIYQRISS